ncbi:MAG: phosphatidylglycerophosphatase A [Puniceicoccales bacterium]|nr:phosphatidylglycerophosphatase A [Puniceicoccales bacterium]
MSVRHLHGKRSRNFWHSAILFFGTCAFSGLHLPAPGTVGSFLGIFFYLIFFRGMDIVEFFIAYAAAIIFAICICGRSERILRVRDPSAVNLDEFVAMPLCYWPLDTLQRAPEWLGWKFLLFGFFLFRLLDICKPFGINRLQKLPSGLGIVIDDLAAAALTGLFLPCIFLWLR